MYLQISEQCLQNDSFSELMNEDDSFVKVEPNVVEEELPFDENAVPSDTEERSHRLLLDEDEIDHEMLADGMKFECVRTFKLGVYTYCLFIY